jgi:hypothetical protein
MGGRRRLSRSGAAAGWDLEDSGAACEVAMAFLSEERAAKLGGHTLEVRSRNHVLRGHVHRLLFDGNELASVQNFWKVPMLLTLEARMSIEGADRHVVVSVRQRWLTTDYSLTVDGEPVPLVLVK